MSQILEVKTKYVTECQEYGSASECVRHPPAKNERRKGRKGRGQKERLLF